MTSKASSPTESHSLAPTRRAFLQASSALAAGLVPAASLARRQPAGENKLRVALVGCGGRGTGAARQALSTDGPVELVAMADAFADNLERSHRNLSEALGDRIAVPASRRFAGFDAYEKAIDADDVDLVILATPPGFRPQHFARAVAAGKHVFTEKPMAVDAPGVRQVLEANEIAKKKNLKIGVGLQRHHDPMYLETIQRIQDGAIGEVKAMRAYWNSEGVWVRARKPEMTEMEYQMRNWYYFNWLCGDHIVEQHIHNIDVANWVKGSYPVTAQGQGGREVRDDKDHGEIFDHHFVEFTYQDGTVLLSQCRHQKDCWNNVSEHAHGAHGNAELSAGKIEAAGGLSWKYDGPKVDPYQAEHDHLFAAIRKDLPFNEGDNGALSTMTSILGRMATYSGKQINWDDAISSKISIAPGRYAWDASPPATPDENGRYAIPVPGKSRVV